MKKSLVDVLMIVKNEEKGIKTTIDSLQNFEGRILIYDTGSTDDTINVINSYQQPEKIFIGHGEFKNFAQARNDAQKWALNDYKTKWVLWMDANDTLRGEVPKLAKGIDGYLVPQEWNHNGNNPTCFYNTRLFKLNKECVWNAPVHEWLKLPTKYTTGKISPQVMCIVQDRTKDSESSVSRWKRDVDMLLEYSKEFPEDSRTCFYLGRAYKDIGDLENAKIWLQKRAEMKNFPEERYWAKVYLGEIAISQQENDEGLKLLNEAYYICNRAEALVIAGRLCNNLHKFDEAFKYLSTVCLLSYPKDGILFVNLNDYKYERWHLLGICSFYAKHFNIGKMACEKAIEEKNLDIDKHNLNFYC